MNCQHIKKSRLKHDQITNDLLPDLVIVLRWINFKSIPSLEEHWCIKVRKTTRRGGLNCVFGNFFFYVLDNCPQVQSVK